MQNTPYNPNLTTSSQIQLLLKALLAVATITVVGMITYTAFSDGGPQQTGPDGSYWNKTASAGAVEKRESVAGDKASGPPQKLEEQADRLGSFIGIDLAGGSVYQYKNGGIAQTYPVIVTGQDECSEIPNGQYEIGYRNDRHFPGSSQAYLPYSLQFGDRFLIHGQPRHPAGSETISSGSEDCLRLSTTDAKTLFASTAENTPVIVVGGDENETGLTQPQTPPPYVSAKSYLVADIETGHVFAQKQTRSTFPIASITKLMTALVANENIAHNDTVEISDSAVATYGQAGGLRSGEQMVLEDLYLPLLLESSNDAATAIAEHYEASQFIRLMNRKALTLDMSNTQFHDPSGLSDQNTSSARDLFRLARHLFDKKRFILDLTTETQRTTPDPDSHALRNFTNNNPIVGQADFLGGKNGYTDNARHTLLSVFETEIDGTERQVVIIVLGSESHATDTRKLLTWLRQAT